MKTGKEMNPTRLVSFAIGGFAAIGILAVAFGAGEGWGSASRDDEAAGVELADAGDRGDSERSAREEPADGDASSQEFDSWVDDPGEDSFEDMSSDDGGGSDGEAASEEDGSDGDGGSDGPGGREVTEDEAALSE